MQTTTISSKAAQTSTKTSPTKSRSRSSSTKLRKRSRGRSHHKPSYLDKEYILDFDSSDSAKTPRAKSKTSKEKKGTKKKRYVSLESKFL